MWKKNSMYSVNVNPYNTGLEAILLAIRLKQKKHKYI